MAEYINRDATIKAILDVYEYGFPTASGAFDDFATKIVPSLLNSIPAADVVPVRCSKWIPGVKECPVCGESKFKDLDADIWADWQPPRCPNCGAKMRENNEI